MVCKDSFSLYLKEKKHRSVFSDFNFNGFTVGSPLEMDEDSNIRELHDKLTVELPIVSLFMYCTVKRYSSILISRIVCCNID